MPSWITWTADQSVGYGHAEDLGVIRQPYSTSSTLLIPMTGYRNSSLSNLNQVSILNIDAVNSQYTATASLSIQTGWLQDFIGLPSGRILTVDTGAEVTGTNGLYPYAPLQVFSLSTSGLSNLQGGALGTTAFWHSGSVADVNLDGSLEAFVANADSRSQSYNFGVFEIQQDGSLIEKPLMEANPFSVQNGYSQPQILALINANGDAYPDLFLGQMRDDWSATPLNKNAWILYGGSSGYSLNNSASLPLPALSASVNARTVSYDKVRSADINSDGRDDLILQIANDSFRALQILTSNSDGSYSDVTNQLMPVGFAWAVTANHPNSGWSDSVELIDVNGDNLKDIVITEPYCLVSEIHKFIYLQGINGQFRESTDIEIGLASDLPMGITLSSQTDYWRFEDVDKNGAADILLSVAPWLGTSSGAPVHYLKLNQPSSGITELLGSQSYVDFGTDFADMIDCGLSGHTLYLAGGNDIAVVKFYNYFVDGETGIDSLDLRRLSGDVSISSQNGQYSIFENATSKKVADFLNIERIVFSDTSLALDINGSAGVTAKILGAVFGQGSLSNPFNPTHVGIGLNYLDGGMSYESLMALALNAAGATTNTAVVNLLWTNLFGLAPTADQAAPYVAMLNSGTTAGALGVMAADTSINTINISLVGLANTGISYV